MTGCSVLDMMSSRPEKRWEVEEVQTRRGTAAVPTTEATACKREGGDWVCVCVYILNEEAEHPADVSFTERLQASISGCKKQHRSIFDDFNNWTLSRLIRIAEPREWCLTHRQHPPLFPSFSEALEGNGTHMSEGSFSRGAETPNNIAPHKPCAPQYRTTIIAHQCYETSSCVHNIRCLFLLCCVMSHLPSWRCRDRSRAPV